MNIHGRPPPAQTATTPRAEPGERTAERNRLAAACFDGHDARSQTHTHILWSRHDAHAVPCDLGVKLSHARHTHK